MRKTSMEKIEKEIEKIEKLLERIKEIIEADQEGMTAHGYNLGKWEGTDPD